MASNGTALDSELRRLICEVFSAEEDQLDDKTNIRGLEGWESLKHMEFIVRLQDIFKIELTSEEIARLQDLPSIRSILGSRTGT